MISGNKSNNCSIRFISAIFMNRRRAHYFSSYMKILSNLGNFLTAKLDILKNEPLKVTIIY